MPFRVYLLIVLALLVLVLLRGRLSSDKDLSRFLPVAAATPAGGITVEPLQCVTASDIQALRRAARGEDKPQVTMWGVFAGPPREEFAHCHIQGLAVSMPQNVVVSTCMGAGATRPGRAAHILVHDLLNGAMEQQRQTRDHYSVLLYERDRGAPRFEQGGIIPDQAFRSRGKVFTHPSATQIVESVRRPGRGLDAQNASFQGGTRLLTLRSFLSANAIRATDSLDNIDWCSSNNSTDCAVKSISVPVLVTAMGAHYFVRDSEVHYEMAASKDKDFIVIEGATHGGTPCAPCETTPGQYSNTVKNLFDYVAKWINSRY